ncbi:MAG: Hpt domain-containing protein [Flavobacterium sp.]|nr:MAG: Hpt domain-containing protein [Flavobacterium sp.]
MIDNSKNTVPLDLSYLREMSGDSAEFMIEMLDAFLTQTPIYISDLEREVIAENWKGASECAHKIKPTFFYIGREDVRDHMQEIERNARELKNIETIPTAFEEVRVFAPILYQQLEEAKIALTKEL